MATSGSVDFNLDMAEITTKPSATTFTITVPVGTFAAAETITGSSSAATTTVSAAVSLVDCQSTVDILEVVLRRSGEDIGITRIS